MLLRFDDMRGTLRKDWVAGGIAGGGESRWAGMPCGLWMNQKRQVAGSVLVRRNHKQQSYGAAQMAFVWSSRTSVAASGARTPRKNLFGLSRQRRERHHTACRCRCRSVYPTCSRAQYPRDTVDN